MYTHILTHSDTIEGSLEINRSHCLAVLHGYMTTNGSDYPWSIG